MSKAKSKNEIEALTERVRQLELALYSLMIGLESHSVAIDVIVTRHKWEGDVEQAIRDFQLAKNNSGASNG